MPAPPDQTPPSQILAGSGKSFVRPGWPWWGPQRCHLTTAPWRGGGPGPREAGPPAASPQDRPSPPAPPHRRGRVPTDSRRRRFALKNSRLRAPSTAVSAPRSRRFKTRAPRGPELPETHEELRPAHSAEGPRPPRTGAAGRPDGGPRRPAGRRSGPRSGSAASARGEAVGAGVGRVGRRAGGRGRPGLAPPSRMAALTEALVPFVPEEQPDDPSQGDMTLLQPLESRPRVRGVLGQLLGGQGRVRHGWCPEVLTLRSRTSQSQRPQAAPPGPRRHPRRKGDCHSMASCLWKPPRPLQGTLPRTGASFPEPHPRSTRSLSRPLPGPTAGTEALPGPPRTPLGPEKPR